MKRKKADNNNGISNLKKESWIHSIKAKLVGSMLIIFLILTIVISAVAGYSIEKSTMSSIDITFENAAIFAANNFGEQITTFDVILTEISTHLFFQATNISASAVNSLLKEKTDFYGTTYRSSFSFAGVNGINAATGTDVSTQDFFTRSIAGEHFLSDPIPVGGDDLIFIYSIPVDVNGKIVGVLYMTFDYEYFYELISANAIGATGEVYAINSGGTTVLHNNKNRVLDLANTQRDAETDPTLEALAAIHSGARSGGTGFGTYFFGGINKIAGYAPIPASNGWSFIANSYTSEFTTQLIPSVILTASICLIIAVVAMIIIMILANSIVNPIKLCVDRIGLLAKGDLLTPAPDIKSKGEMKQLAESTRIIVEALHVSIADQEYMLTEMAHGNFTVESKVEHIYIGDFATLIDSIHIILKNLNNSLTEINVASTQVSSGSDQVASGAQQLSQGATEQASAIEQLSATFATLSTQITQTAGNAEHAKGSAGRAEHEVTDASQKMDEMMTAITGISTKSHQIGKIIKTIEDIAFQTNILALNAAVEAARAGEAGKGFAVVADEVRNLATKSTEAAKNTAVLIEDTINAVQLGTSIANQTSTSIQSVVASATEIIGFVELIATTTREQANGIVEITTGVDQIASVVQTNSATAEQSAAASEELSSQAQLLRKQVSQFKLLDRSLRGNENQSYSDNTPQERDHRIKSGAKY